MSPRPSHVLVLVCLLPVVSGAADLMRGVAVYQGCAPCHGARGEGSRDGEVPRLAGQPPRFLEDQLRAFRSGARGPVMLSWVVGLADADLTDVAAVLAQNPVPMRGEGAEPVPVVEGDAQAGGRLFKRRCGACHGAQGRGRGRYPGLVGLHPAWLQRQVLTVSAGLRPHGDDERGTLILKGLPLDQVRDILAWLGRQQAQVAPGFDDPEEEADAPVDARGAPPEAEGAGRTAAPGGSSPFPPTGLPDPGRGGGRGRDDQER